MRNVAVAALAVTLTLGAVCLTACGPEQPAAPAAPAAPAEGGQVDGEGLTPNEVSEK